MRSKRSKWSLLLMLMFLLMLVLSACGGGEDEPSEAEGDADTTETDDGSDATEDSGGEKTLVFARGGDSESLDPGSTSDGESSRVTRQVLETLIDFAPDSFELEPGLAKEWEVSDDGLKYTFYLQEGVKFHDGTDFNAEAVKINFDRFADPEHEYAFADHDYVYFMYSAMFGGHKGDEGHVVDEVVVVDDHTVEFNLNTPLGFFLQNMGMTYFAITSPAALEEYGPEINENPVGTGPFKFISWTKDDSIILEKNEDYWKEGLPKLDRLIFEVIPDNAARLIALRSGDIDIMDGLNPDDAAGVETDEDLTLYARDENNFGYVGFNVQNEPLDNELLRQAISHAIDREAIVDALYAGYGTVAKNPLPPSYLGYNDDVEGYQYDVEKAKEVLAEAGYEDGLEIDLWTMPVARPYMPDPEKTAEIIQNNLAEIGITVNIVREEWAPYLEKTAAGEHQIYMLGWSGTNGDPDYFLSSLLHGDLIGDSNREFYQSDKVDQLLNEAKVEIDQEKRADMYKEAQAIIAEDVPMVPLVHSTPVMASSSTVKNYVPHLSTSESLEEVDLE
ncbi:peptide/nickel transport system substrate-binding protein [Pseudogracilibacillus auburnensis]|uniref:Peptide/nickel transport system substrate-binding protein n=2 Tax=Pseudogracilibacillus auburnensis TaxID=1494959 RepID=A0A2V3WC93_9BACI|nr:peptide/nickel transport system substrate-binding protein [Pseudogracilibacillus auburnensis]